MKELNYTCTHMDFNKSYGCMQCEEEKKNNMDKMDKRVNVGKDDTNFPAAAKTMRKG